MKTLSNLVKQFCTIKFTVMVLIIASGYAEAQPLRERKTPDGNQSIMLALLLDTSNSMDGLIDQAKSQLWKIVNELASAKCSDGKKPDIRIALYEYGNNRLLSSEGYIRMVSPLTSDLDLISEKLFSLSTNGGEEYCGYVIRNSLTQLDWNSSKSDLKLIFIAGNEPFTQGSVSYTAACSLAKEKGVVVNTIFCGDFSEGVETQWRAGANLTGGSYMSIEQDRKTVYVPTPYDDRIDALNAQMNETYVYYGRNGASKKAMQSAQDSNAEVYGKSNKVERAVSKSSHAYQNSSWDLVDASKENEKAIADAKDDELPKEMKGMSVEKRKEYVKQKSAERQRIQSEIMTLNKKRQEYISTHSPKDKQQSMLDDAMIRAIREQAKTKSLNWN